MMTYDDITLYPTLYPHADVERGWGLGRNITSNIRNEVIEQQQILVGHAVWRDLQVLQRLQREGPVTHWHILVGRPGASNRMWFAVKERKTACSPLILIGFR